MQSKPPASGPDIFIFPDTRRHRVTLRGRFAEPGEPGRVAVRIEGAAVAEELDLAGGDQALPYPDYTPWTPETPALQTLVVEGDGWRRTLAFGMREFQVKEGRFALNHRQLPLRMTRFAPASGMTAEAVIAALRHAREAGFNTVALETAAIPEAALDCCDEAGLLLWVPLDAATLRDRAKLDAQVGAWQRHPSIAAWTLPEPEQPPREAEETRASWVRAVRGLDASRLLVHAGTPATALGRGAPGWHVQPHHEEQRPLLTLPVRFGEPAAPEATAFFDALPRLDVPVLLVDDGVPAPAADDGALADAVAEKRLEPLFAPNADTGAAPAQQVQALAAVTGIGRLRAQRNLAGYCWGALCDAPETPWAGLLDAAAAPKPAFAAVTAAQTPMHLVVRMESHALSPRDEVGVEVLLVSDSPADDRADLSLQVVGPTGQVLWKKRRGVRVPKYGGRLWSGQVSASGSEGPHRFVVRLLKGPKRLAEHGASFHVLSPPEPVSMPVDVVDPDGLFAPVWSGLVRRGRGNPAVVVLPPLANTVRAYPAEEVAQMLAEVREGASGLVFEPPADWDDFAHAAHVPEADLDAPGAALHFARLHPVFEELPARTFLGPAYQAVMPRMAFGGDSDEDICGCLRLDGRPWWGHHVRVRRHGAGRLYFVSLRVFPAAGENPLAARLLVNLVRHAARSAFPREATATAEQAVIGWLRRERHDHARRWLVTGLFPNWDGAGHDTALPPETAAKPGRPCAVPHGEAAWRTWWSTEGEGHAVDLFEARGLPLASGHEGVPGCAYAYAEFNAPGREQLRLHIDATASVKVWLNGTLAYEERRDRGTPAIQDATAAAWTRQGRNTLLVKLSAHLTPARFALRFESEHGPQTLTWWR